MLTTKYDPQGGSQSCQSLIAAILIQALKDRDQEKYNEEIVDFFQAPDVVWALEEFGLDPHRVLSKVQHGEINHELLHKPFHTALRAYA